MICRYAFYSLIELLTSLLLLLPILSLNLQNNLDKLVKFFVIFCSVRKKKWIDWPCGIFFGVGSCTFCTESTEVVNLVGGDPKLKQKADERQTIQIDSIDWYSNLCATRKPRLGEDILCSLNFCVVNEFIYVS